MRLFLILLALLIGFAAKSQDTTVYFILDEGHNGVMPQFKGGESALYKFLGSNIHYPQLAKEKCISGRVFVTFVIEKDGSLTHAKIVAGIGGGCDLEALRVVNMMNGMWSPGTKNGQPVRVQFNIPVKFTLQDGGNPSDPTLSYNKGLDLMKEEKYDKALDYFMMYSQADMIYSDALYASGICRFMMSDYKGSITDWENARDEGHKGCAVRIAEAYMKLGNQYQAEKKYPVAISCFTKSLENAPNDVNVLYNRGIAWLYLGDKEKACEDWKRISELGSEDSKALMEEYCQ